MSSAANGWGARGVALGAFLAVACLEACGSARPSGAAPADGGADAGTADAAGDSDVDADTDADTDADSDSDTDSGVGDEDGDGIPDDLDPDPETPAEVIFEDDFSEPREEWVLGGEGDWGVDEEARLLQTHDCHDGLTGYTLDFVDEADVYVRVSLNLDPREDPCVTSYGAGLLVRRDDDSPRRERDFHACLLHSGPRETMLSLMHFTGEVLEFVDWSRESVTSSEPVARRWVTVSMLAEGRRLVCRVEEIPELTVETEDWDPAAGALGLASHRSRESFDDFLAVRLGE